MLDALVLKRLESVEEVRHANLRRPVDGPAFLNGTGPGDPTPVGPGRLPICVTCDPVGDERKKLMSDSKIAHLRLGLAATHHPAVREGQ